MNPLKTLILTLSLCGLGTSLATASPTGCTPYLCTVPTADFTIAVGSPLWVSPDRYWLAGFDPNVTLQTAGEALNLIRPTDGLPFRRVSPEEVGELPHWVDRYPADTVALYRANKSGEGTHFVVLVPRQGQVLAHWYDPSGERTTFVGSGGFVAYRQTADQQYRSAAAGDPEGLAPGSPKTAYTYLDERSGLLSRKTDEQGRETRYDWDAPTRRLLLVTETGPGGQDIVKRTELRYLALWRYHYLSEVTERTFDGLGGEAVRRTRYGYSEYSKPEYLNYDVRLTSESREVLGRLPERRRNAGSKRQRHGIWPRLSAAYPATRPAARRSTRTGALPTTRPGAAAAPPAASNRTAPPPAPP